MNEFKLMSYITIVLFFASINVSSLYYALRNGDRVVVLKKNEQVVRDKINFPD